MWKIGTTGPCISLDVEESKERIKSQVWGMNKNAVVTFLEIVSTGRKGGLRGKRFERIEKRSKLRFGLQFETVVGCEGGDVLRAFENTRLKL